MRECSGPLCIDQLKEHASSFEGFAYPNENKHRFIIYIRIYLYSFYLYYMKSM